MGEGCTVRFKPKHCKSLVLSVGETLGSQLCATSRPQLFKFEFASCNTGQPAALLGVSASSQRSRAPELLVSYATETHTT